MRILQVHNHYRIPGGEDQVFDAEARLLEAHGDRVCRYEVHNDNISGWTSLADAGKAIWNSSTYRDLRALIQAEQPEVVHFHNTFPLVSPSAYYAAAAEGVPVVQTLHNYRLLCPAATFFRDGRTCEECVEKGSFLPGIVHGCYRNSRIITAVTAGMLSFHRAIGTWEASIDVYIALSEFSRRKFTDAGFPARKVVLKPNFVQPSLRLGWAKEDFVLFAGRLGPEKGIKTLLEGWRQARLPWRLKIAGDGPLAQEVRDATTQTNTIEWVGHKTNPEVRALIAAARFVIVPSEWYEAMPCVVVEAYAEHTPVLAANIGALSELIVPGKTGLLFEAGNLRALATELEWIFQHSELLPAMGEQAHNQFVVKYSPDSNYKQLCSIYSRVAAAPIDSQVAKPARLQHPEPLTDDQT
jgi:glycosyltransferase involved in cell wall biosynthesis